MTAIEEGDPRGGIAEKRDGKGRQLGLEEGLAEGIRKRAGKGQRVAALRIARQMLADGRPRDLSSGSPTPHG